MAETDIETAVDLPDVSADGGPAAAARPRKTGLARAVELLPRGLFLLMHIGAFTLPFVVGLLTWPAAALMVGLFVLRTFGLTAGYHRYFAHRAYQTSRWFQFCLAWFGAMAVQRGPMWWAGHHRDHHKHSDQEGDPHSPVLRTVWWSHLGWVLSDEVSDPAPANMKDWQKFPELWWLDKYDWVPGVLTAGLCYAAAGLPGLVYGFLVSTVVLYHTTFMVNSVCHLFGTRRFETSDHSRNNPFVAIVTMGEGWHNNHHHYPSAARQGFRWYELDLSFAILRLLSMAGVVWGLRQPTPRALAKNRVGA